MTVKELIDFLSRENPNAKVTLTKTAFHEPEDGFGEPWDEDETTELMDYCLTVDVLGSGDVDIRWL